MTTAGEIEELHTKRIRASEMVVSNLNGEFIFPIKKHNWPQQNDGRKLTRQVRAGKDLRVEEPKGKLNKSPAEKEKQLSKKESRN